MQFFITVSITIGLHGRLKISYVGEIDFYGAKRGRRKRVVFAEKTAGHKINNREAYNIFRTELTEKKRSTCYKSTPVGVNGATNQLIN